MKIVVNGEKHAISNGCSAAALVSQLQLGDQRIAVEINREIVLRSELGSHILQPGDQVEIVRAIGGG